MAHFAELDENNIVTQVVVVNDLDCRDENNFESESVGVHFLRNIFGATTEWKQTSYNDNIRKQYAGIGFTYDEDNDIFWPPKPYPSWVKDTSDAQWHSPVGDAPALTAEQQSQNEAGTHLWGHDWNESGQTWELSNKLA